MRLDDQLYPIEKIYRAAEAASSPELVPVADLVALLADDDSAVRYWGATGLLIRGREAVAEAREPLRKALEDPAPAARIPAAEALGRYGSDADTRAALDVLIELANAEKNVERMRNLYRENAVLVLYYMMARRQPRT